MIVAEADSLTMPYDVYKAMQDVIKAETNVLDARNKLERLQKLASTPPSHEIKFHGTTGIREVCVRFFNTQWNNAPDGETFVIMNDEGRVVTSNGLECTHSHGDKGIELQSLFRAYKIDRVEFTNLQADANTGSRKFGKERWQIVKVYGHYH